MNVTTLRATPVVFRKKLKQEGLDELATSIGTEASSVR